ncbi:MAG: hypothetical protein KDA81_11570 [Planctomycetaceae bacterium]|nr:hypothetical protein [Planctomycetaceae bacterium]MCA9084690.1 hypothetical protein [Planctomycetaceae bacterium]
MSSTITNQSNRSHAFAIGMATFACVSMVLTALLPMGMSVAIVLLFAGPHNYVEARYFLTRLPARMGKLKNFFLFSAAGIVTLTTALPLLIRMPVWAGWSPETVLWTVGAWNTGLILWGTILVSMRAQQPPRRAWDYAWPTGLALIGVSWLQPLVLPLVLVYLHPLIGFWVLDREIAQRRREWQRGFRAFLLLLPALVLLLWQIAADPFGSDAFSEGIRQQIRQHAGTGWFSATMGRRMITTHAFLELLHYGVWIVAVPLASGRVFFSAFDQIPLMRSSSLLTRSIRIGLMLSAGIVVLLWLAFAADYSTTRDIYFMVATLHVLAEVPFLLRLL